MGLRFGVALVVSIWMSGCSASPPWEPPGEIQEQLLGILGGQETEHWPAVGAYAIDGGHSGMCTAVLVAPDWVLTAAHCAVDAGDNDTFVMAPDLDAAHLSDLHGVAEAFPHPGYDGHGQHPHDVALLRLTDPVEDVDFIPVTAELPDSAWSGTWLHYVGYGADTYFGGPGAGMKRETDLQIAWVTSHEFATYAEDSNYCSGDSGGPGFVELEGRWYVAGVVSSVYAKENGEDMCEGGGWTMRVDAELGFLDDHYDVEIEPDEWYQPPDEGDDDDSAAADDDDDSAAADDDDDDSAEIEDDEEPDGCQCVVPGQGSRPMVYLASILLAMGLLVTRRR